MNWRQQQAFILANFHKQKSLSRHADDEDDGQTEYDLERLIARRLKALTIRRDYSRWREQPRTRRILRRLPE